MLPISDFVVAGFYFSGIVLFLSSLLLLALYKFRWKSDSTFFLMWVCTWIASAFLTWSLVGNSIYIFAAIAIHAIVTLIFSPLFRKISVFGVFFLGSMWAPSIFTLLWFKELFGAISPHLGWFSGILVGILGILFSLLMLVNLAMLSWVTLVRYSSLYFRFPRLHEGLEKAREAETYTPFVSLHLPCYNEPPEIVIETLNSLSQLDYPHFEVIVLDNNTKDSSLWKPVQEHCTLLGKNFRFYHFDQVKGAKAGALNMSLKLTAPEAEIVSVIDADYVAQKDFLSSLIGFFADPQVGFVQTCQDYRDWKENVFKKACYFEYGTHFKLELGGQNEWDASYTVGTMCLIRRQLLDQVGGWAEWCLTEDSEVAVRIHALGYQGYYINATYGRGLIPDTFEGYRLQRFRWCVGPVQQFLKHYKLYSPWGNIGKLKPMQKFGEISHSLANFFTETLSTIINVPILLICLWYTTKNGVSIKVPYAFLFLIVIAFVRTSICNWVTACLLGGNWKSYLLSSMAVRSLMYVRNLAVYSALFSSTHTWHRTNKFKETSNLSRVVSSTKQEIIGGTICLGIVCLLFPFISILEPDILFLIWLGIVNQTLSFWCAPLMAYLSERCITQ